MAEDNQLVIYKHSQGFELEMIKEQIHQVARVGDSNRGLPDCEFDMLATQPCFPLIELQ